MDPQENCNSTPGGLLADSGEGEGVSATLTPTSPKESTVGHPREICSEPDQEPEVELCIGIEALDALPFVPTPTHTDTDVDHSNDWIFYSELERPKKYSDCAAVGLGSPGRPCPYASCEHHAMFTIVDGEYRLTYDTDEIDEMPFTCFAYESAIPLTLESIGERLNISKERVRQIQNEALAKLKDGRQEPLREFEYWEFEKEQTEEGVFQWALMK